MLLRAFCPALVALARRSGLESLPLPHPPSFLVPVLASPFGYLPFFKLHGSRAPHPWRGASQFLASSTWRVPRPGGPQLDRRDPSQPGGGWLAKMPGKPGGSNRAAGCSRSLGGRPSGLRGKRGCGVAAALPSGGLRPGASLFWGCSLLPAVRALSMALQLRGSTRSKQGSCSEATGRSSGRKAGESRGGEVRAGWEPGCLSALALSRSRRNSERSLLRSEGILLAQAGSCAVCWVPWTSWTAQVEGGAAGGGSPGPPAGSRETWWGGVPSLMGASLLLSCNSLVALPWRGRGLARSGGGGTCSLGLSTLPAWWTSVGESLPRREVRAGSCLRREAVAPSSPGGPPPGSRGL